MFYLDLNGTYFKLSATVCVCVCVCMPMSVWYTCVYMHVCMYKESQNQLAQFWSLTARGNHCHRKITTAVSFAQNYTLEMLVLDESKYKCKILKMQNFKDVLNVQIHHEIVINICLTKKGWELSYCIYPSPMILAPLSDFSTLLHRFYPDSL